MADAIFPSADRIALAIVMAARFHREDPLAIVRGGTGSRGRVLAYAVLVEAFPQARKAGLSRCCAFVSQAAASAHLNQARKAKWWNEDHLDEVVGALVADEVEPEEPSASRAAPQAAPADPPAGRATTRDRRSPLRPLADVEIPHFEPDERRLIARMHAGGADAAAIGAALGAGAAEVAAWLAAQEG